MKTRANAVIFDLDGTLVDTVKINVAVWRETFRKNGKDVPAEKIEPLIGTSAHRIITECFDPNAGAELENSLKAEKSSLFLPRIIAAGKSLLFPEVEATLTLLQDKGIKMGIGSANSREAVNAMVSTAHLDRFFKIAVSAEDVNNMGKPNPSIFLETARLLKVDPMEAVIVGDADSDMEAARNGGFGLAVQFAYGKQLVTVSKHTGILVCKFHNISYLI